MNKIEFEYNFNNIINGDINRAYKHWLMCSYLYYELDVNVINDDEFNMLSRYLLDNYNHITDMYKHLVTKDNFKSSTGYDIKYPTMIKHLAIDYYNGFKRR